MRASSSSPSSAALARAAALDDDRDLARAPPPRPRAPARARAASRAASPRGASSARAPRRRAAAPGRVRGVRERLGEAVRAPRTRRASPRGRAATRAARPPLARCAPAGIPGRDAARRGCPRPPAPRRAPTGRARRAPGSPRPRPPRRASLPGPKARACRRRITSATVSPRASRSSSSATRDSSRGAGQETRRARDAEARGQLRGHARVLAEDRVGLGERRARPAATGPRDFRSAFPRRGAGRVCLRALTGNGKIARTLRVSLPGVRDSASRRCVCSGLSSLPAAAEIVDRIAATVNDAAIPESEVRKAMVVSALAPGAGRVAEAFRDARPRCVDRPASRVRGRGRASALPPPDAAEIEAAMERLSERLRGRGEGSRGGVRAGGADSRRGPRVARAPARDLPVPARTLRADGLRGRSSRRARSTRSATCPSRQAAGQPVRALRGSRRGDAAAVLRARVRRGGREMAERSAPEVADLDLSDSAGLIPTDRTPVGRVDAPRLRRTSQRTPLLRADTGAVESRSASPVMISP